MCSLKANQMACIERYDTSAVEADDGHPVARAFLATANEAFGMASESGFASLETLMRDLGLTLFES
jgi:hypothetical protein